MARARLEVDAETSARMGRVRQKGTAAELAVRAATSAMGLHYRVENRKLAGRPDLANRSGHWAILVHGCFWHRHRGCHRTTTPKRNAQFWNEKFQANVARDRRVVTTLRREGFRVLVIWECETEKPSTLDRRLRTFFRVTG